MIYAFWCGLSVMFSVLGIVTLSNVKDDHITQLVYAVLLLLLMLTCGFMGWMLADEHIKEKQEKENQKEVEV